MPIRIKIKLYLNKVFKARYGTYWFVWYRSKQHRHDIVIRGGALLLNVTQSQAKKLKTTILDKLGTKQTCLDKKFKVEIKGHFTFVVCFCWLFLALFF